MNAQELDRTLRQQGIRPSAQRLAIAGYVLATGEHPSADTVWHNVKPLLPMVSRATVYNTLRLLVDRGLLRELAICPGAVVYDANMAPHHHFIDDGSGAVRDLPWQSLFVERVAELAEFDVREYSVVLRGRRRSSA